ncbi:hypothetical protein [Glutamicibacter sp. M10]|uniref:hypothetical protein n=1 Tax=Glutamicibacter sp. M10 TaxID=3023076 RepID=UPI0021C98AC5|nr:hypothetical protein [Glutamicibacter sp. M10]UXN31020.1 hypothetical protein N6V40_11375 [Glutamicibacter sp. M10]
MAYPYPGFFAIDPNNPSGVAIESTLTIFDPADTAQTPILLTDSEGLQLANPLTTNQWGFVGAFYADLDQVSWVAGELVGLEQSFDGVRNMAITAEENSGISADLARDAANDAAIAKQAAIDAATLVTAPSSAAVETMINTEGSAPRIALEQHFTRRGELYANVWDFGAVGDGITDDSEAFRQAALYLRGTFGQDDGGTIVARPSGDFNLGSQVRLFSNQTVDLEYSHVRRTADAGYVAFCAYSGGAAGYGSGGRNIALKRIRFHGDFTNGRALNNIFHHVDGLILEDLHFDQAVVNGHGLDIMGCRKVRAKRVTGAGRYEVAGRAYVELMQIDHSTKGGAGGELAEADTAWDGLPCVDVIMEDSKTYPLELNGTTYLAPRLIGSHSRVERLRHKTIKILGCEITDSGITTNDGNYQGWIHLIHAEDVLIDGLTINSSIDGDTIFIGIGAVDQTYPLSSVAQSSPAADMTVGPVSCKDVRIRNVKINGAGGTAQYSAIRARGWAGYPLEGLSIEANAENLSPATDTTFLAGGTLAYISYADTVKLNLRASKAMRVVNANNCNGLTIQSLEARTIHRNVLQIQNSLGVVVNNSNMNEVISAGYLSGIIGLDLHNNASDSTFVGVGPFEHFWGITGCTDVATSGNRGKVPTGSPLKYLMNWYGNTSSSSSLVNQGRGFTKVNNIQSGSTVTEANSVLLSA